ncbi:aminotransferase class V-fold PLP-dependent enzyme [Roseibacterium sp. SDUM158017]|uniref:aminotransferase class V-fold PLP-dependent enzyme n=1 Tax=Roseicyclus salinarum TaxID=3036773 RepID=UPI002414D8BF|nr:aminotransferase class V-fold PLP-dependent enzyme [Roseibacterium sp. SDUM158017]MDG4648703.1 aminotransferase class V-fold PLP-dependent enzyme [Roseibacterium sp. SDUM158017]
MIADNPALLTAIRDRFAHVDACPFEGPRVFFENAGGALRLKSVIETSAVHAGYPDNQGRANAASEALMAVIARGKADMRLFFNAGDAGEVFVGESGTEVLFRLVRTAALAAPEGGVMLGSTLEHPATYGAMARWSDVTGRTFRRVAHDSLTGSVSPQDYSAAVTPDTRVVTIVHTSPVTGMAVDVPAIAAAVREVAPEAFIIVDGIQHASHGAVDVVACHADGYAVSPYKMFSRHGYGVGWASDRLTAATKEQIIGGAPTTWELGTRDSGAYATFSDVVAYLDWLGGEAGADEAATPRARIEAAAAAIAGQEAVLLKAMLHGYGNLPGLAQLPSVTLIGGDRVEGREGVISLRLETMPSAELVEHLRQRGIRVHIRKNDHYSGNVLEPLGMEDCIRVSVSHYNSLQEVARFLGAMREATE